MNATTGYFGFAHPAPQAARASGSAIRNTTLRSSASLRSTSPQSAIRNLSTAFTLVELMVSIAILTGIILVVSQLLTNAQRAVGLSQDTVKADAGARAAVDRMRADLAGLTTEGFLAIYTDINGGQHLVFTAVGSYRSMTETVDPVVANAARIDYGLIGSPNNVLWRRVFLLNAESAATTAGDREKISLADCKAWNRVNVDFALYNAGGLYTWGGETFNCFVTQPSITLPPNSLSEVNALWPYLARPGSNLKIDWTDGTLDVNGLITWYNSDAPKAAWAGRGAGDNVIEYCNLAGKYCALWTHWKKNNWPSALRITFTLGTGETARTYEVIVDLPR